jgi:hypothetical protein
MNTTRRPHLNRHGVHRKKQEAKVLAHRKAVRGSLPRHKHWALQPASLLVVLCVGVLLIACTLNALADTYTVTAVVPAAPLTVPAIITAPNNGTQTSTQTLAVQGTCPNGSYVTVTDNGIMSGVASCSSGRFIIDLDLSPGSNELQAQDYNITNAAGPISNPISVTYTQQQTTNSSSKPTSTGTIVVPRRLLVSRVDTNTPYTSSTAIPKIGSRPTLTGVAPPYSLITIVLKPDLYTCKTYADAQGYWSCTMPTTLPPATYAVNITALTPQGVTIVSPGFTVTVVAESQIAPATPQFRITSDYSYRAYEINKPVNYVIRLSGGMAPYAFTISWGDGTVQTMLWQTSDSFTITHAYGWIDAASANKVIKVQAIDAAGQASTLQLPAILRNPAYHTATAGTTSSGNGIWRVFGAIRPWLWLLWPGYAIVVLMVFSFWLGEKQEIALLNTKSRSPSKRKPRHAHAHH